MKKNKNTTKLKVLGAVNLTNTVNQFEMYLTI